MFWEYWEVSHFWQIESETLEARQIFAGAHYFVLFAKRKQRVTAKNFLSKLSILFNFGKLRYDKSTYL